MSILGFQSRDPDIKLLKFHSNRDNWAYIEKHDFQWKFVCQIWDCHWIHVVEMRLTVVLDPDSETEIALHAKQRKVLIVNFTDCLKKCDILQMTSNIDI